MNNPQHLTAKQIQRASIKADLESMGVDVVQLGGECIRLYGAYGNVILTTDIATLTPKEIRRLTGA